MEEMFPRHIILLSIGFSFCITAIILYLIIIFAYGKKRMLDDPMVNGKKHAIHKSAVPTSGGLAIFGGFWITVMVFIPQILNRINKLEIVATYFLTGMLTFIGFIDDLKPISARYRLFVQILTGMIFYLLIGKHKIDFGIVTIDFGIFAPFVYGFFFAGIINSINFIDGLDGLAAGISFFVILVTMYVSYIFKNYTTMLLSSVLLVSVVAFLMFNFHPARIFMGDAGSMFLGTLMGYLSIKAGTRGDAFYIYPFLVVLFIPIVDISWAIIRRLRKRKSIFYPDKEHIHHKLLKSGLGVKGAVLLLWFCTGLLGILAIYSTYYGFVPELVITILLLTLWVSAGWVFKWV